MKLRARLTAAVLALGLCGLAVVTSSPAGATGSGFHDSVSERNGTAQKVAANGWTWRPIGKGRSSCGRFEMCIWWATEYGATDSHWPQGLAMSGNLEPCDLVHWQNTRFHNNVRSVHNNAAGRMMVYNRYDANSWDQLFALVPGQTGNSLPLGTSADAVAYFPGSSCNGLLDVKAIPNGVAE